MSFIDSINNRDYLKNKWFDKYALKYFNKPYDSLDDWELKEFKSIMVAKGFMRYEQHE